MKNSIDRIELLDLTLFDSIPSETTVGDRRSLLAVQRAIAKKHKEYAYLEIGSHLGGSLQQHLLDDRCKRIYSIDPRPSQQPDDRSPGFIAYYDNNSSKRMISLLSNIDSGAVGKVTCIDRDSSQVDPEQIDHSPEYSFIDGEHTKAAALADFNFCDKVVSKHGAILFHDFQFIYPAVLEICRILGQQRRIYLPLKLEDGVFAIFFDPNLVNSDSYLAALYEKNRYFLLLFRIKVGLKRILPRPVRSVIWAVVNLMRRVVWVLRTGDKDL